MLAADAVDIDSSDCCNVVSGPRSPSLLQQNHRSSNVTKRSLPAAMRVDCCDMRASRNRVEPP